MMIRHGGWRARLSLMSALIAGIATVVGVPHTVAQTPTFQITSPAFAEGARIPTEHTCDGANRSPVVQWSGVPAGTQSFVLIVDDPDAPSGTFTHWVLFNLPGARTDLPAGLQPGQVGTSGRNDFGRTGYAGPCPPSGTHRYFFKLHAVSEAALSLREGVSRLEVERAVAGRIVGVAQLMGRYSR